MTQIRSPRTATFVILAVFVAFSCSAVNVLAHSSSNQVQLTLTIRNAGGADLITPPEQTIPLIDRLLELPPIHMRINASYALGLLQTESFWYERVTPNTVQPFSFSESIEQRLRLEVWSDDLGQWVPVNDDSTPYTIGSVPTNGDVFVRYRLHIGESPPPNLTLRIVHTLISGM